MRAWSGSDASGMHGDCPFKAVGARLSERTENMPCMFVTLDVSQSEMSTLTFCKWWKR